MFEEHSRLLRAGHAGRKRDLTDLLTDKRQQAVRDHVVEAEALLAESLLPVRAFPQVDEFVES